MVLEDGCSLGAERKGKGRQAGPKASRQKSKKNLQRLWHNLRQVAWRACFAFDRAASAPRARPLSNPHLWILTAPLWRLASILDHRFWIGRSNAYGQTRYRGQLFQKARLYGSRERRTGRTMKMAETKEERPEEARARAQWAQSEIESLLSPRSAGLRLRTRLEPIIAP